jgi:hypothetical protein
MGIEKIVAISGKQGLFEIVSQVKGKLIVESLIDKKRIPISTMQNVSSLNDISIYTEDSEIPLTQIFRIMSEKKEKIISHKESNDKLISFFGDILPNFDEERVYPSNIRKVILWYSILSSANFDFSNLSEELSQTEEASNKDKK